MSVGGGGWMLLYAYNHVGMQNLALNDTVLPLSPMEGYSHWHLTSLTGYLRTRPIGQDE
jgi:hypothetical protein